MTCSSSKSSLSTHILTNYSLYFYWTKEGLNQIKHEHSRLKTKLMLTARVSAQTKVTQLQYFINILPAFFVRIQIFLKFRFQTNRKKILLRFLTHFLINKNHQKSSSRTLQRAVPEPEVHLWFTSVFFPEVKCLPPPAAVEQDL